MWSIGVTLEDHYSYWQPLHGQYLDKVGLQRITPTKLITVTAWVTEVHKILTLTAKKRDQRDYKNSDKNRLIKMKVKLEAN